MSAAFFSWSRLASARWEDAWVETLWYLGETRLAIFGLPGGKRVRLEVYSLSKREAADLIRRFGGRARKQPSVRGLLERASRRKPLRIRGRLRIVSSAGTAAEKSPSARTLIIPAGLAFGTGEHATTAACLRMICDLSEILPPGWTMLDLGTGSGILAIAGRILGAHRVEALDFDPQSVRTAKENVRLNGVSRVRVRRQDVREWVPAAKCNLVTANLFHQVLMDSAGSIASAVRPGGWLIVSGLLNNQAQETLNSFRRARLCLDREVRSGKWTTLLFAKTQPRVSLRASEPHA